MQTAEAETLPESAMDPPLSVHVPETMNAETLPACTDAPAAGEVIATIGATVSITIAFEHALSTATPSELMLVTRKV